MECVSRIAEPWTYQPSTAGDGISHPGVHHVIKSPGCYCQTNLVSCRGWCPDGVRGILGIQEEMTKQAREEEARKKQMEKQARRKQEEEEKKKELVRRRKVGTLNHLLPLSNV
jgi:hypothetical protein